MTALTIFVRERLPIATFGPILAALSALAIWAAGGLDGAGLTRSASIGASMVLFVVRYRLWDDLADREADRAAFPGRPAVRLDRRSLARGRWLLTGIHVALAAALAPRAALAILLLDAAYVGAYAVRSRLRSFTWRYPILLAKYPSFVIVSAMLVSPLQADRLLAAAAVAYSAAWLYEALHDPHPRGVWS